MGTWGPGLYANDLARDLKSTISSVIRLPLTPAELVLLLTESFPVSNEAENEEYAKFWLVIADQFHKQGVVAPKIYERAIDILKSGKDANSTEIQEMSVADRRKRDKVLTKLCERLATIPSFKQRKTLNKPQPLIMDARDLIVFPLFAHNNCINPHYPARYYQPPGWRAKHTQEGWGAVCIVRSLHVFQYLAVYQPLVLIPRFDLTHKPTVDDLFTAEQWRLPSPGTCT